MAIGIKTQLDQSYAQKVRQQVNVFMDELNKTSNIKVNVDTSDIKNQLNGTVKSISDAIQKLSVLGDVTIPKIFKDENGNIKGFIANLERAKGIIEQIKFDGNYNGAISTRTGSPVPTGFDVSNSTVLNRQNELVQKIAEAQVEEKENNTQLIEQENTKLKVIQMQYEQKLKNVQATAEELQNEELFNRISNFQDKLNGTVSTGAIGQQELKNQYQDLVNYENELVNAKKEEQKVTADAINQQLKEADAIQKSAEQEQARIAKLGELKTSFGEGLFSKSDQEIKSYVQSLYGADAKVVSFKRSLDGLSDSQIKVTVNTKNSKNEIEQEKLILDENTQSVYKNEEAIKANTSRMVGFADRIKNAFTAVAAFASVTAIFYQAVHEIESGIVFINDINKAQTNIQMITNMTSQQVQQLTKDYSQLAGQLHETTSSLTQASQEFLRAGNTIEDTNKLLEASTVMSKIAGQSQQDSAQSLISIMNAFHLKAEDMMSVVDKMVAVD